MKKYQMTIRKTHLLLAMKYTTEYRGFCVNLYYKICGEFCRVYIQLLPRNKSKLIKYANKFMNINYKYNLFKIKMTITRHTIY